MLAIDTGGRRAEILELDVSRCRGGVVTFDLTKSGRSRSVPASARVRAILARRNSGRVFGDLTEYRLDRDWYALKDGIGLGEDASLVVHSLRHTCASRLVQLGVQLQVVQQWMGHESIQTTLRYAHLAPDALKVAVDALDGQQTA